MVALFVAAEEARAKMVYYEINGQRYSYSTNNRKQVEEARQRINAANAADAAKSKAQAERSSNPLAAVFGSKAQSEAKEAETRLKEVVAKPPSAEPPADLRPRRERARAAAKERRVRAARAAPTLRETAARPEPKRSRAASALSGEGANPAPASVAKPAIASVFYDADAGIKTIQMTDGSVHEEPYDPGAAPGLGQAPAPDATGTLQKQKPAN
jgi:hypothetical protein